MEKILSIVETVSLYLVGFSIFGVFVCTGLELGNGAAELALVVCGLSAGFSLFAWCIAVGVFSSGGCQ